MKKPLALALGAMLLTTAAALAQEEKVLNLYNWSDYRADDTLTNFTKETGIKVVEANYDSNEMLEGKLVAGHSGYDVVVPSGFFLQHQIPIKPLPEARQVEAPQPRQHGPGDHEGDRSLRSGQPVRRRLHVGHHRARLQRRPDQEARCRTRRSTAGTCCSSRRTPPSSSDCGITVLDAPSEVVAIALNYLGLDPNSEKPEDLKKAEDLLTSIKPYVRKFDCSGYIDDLANGDACLSLGYSGDVYIAKHRAEDAKKGVNIAYVIPKEGTIEWFDMLAIPADAPHPENALKFINYIMERQGHGRHFQQRVLCQRQQGGVPADRQGDHRRSQHLSAGRRHGQADAAAGAFAGLHPPVDRATWTRIKTPVSTTHDRGWRGLFGPAADIVLRATASTDELARLRNRRSPPTRGRGATPHAKPFVRIRDVTKKFGDVAAGANVSLDIFKGELFCLLGGSGSGKSTLLRMLAGFEDPTAGTIEIDGQDMAGVPPYQRPVNMMFQSYALFPHMTVWDNIAYGLKRDHLPQAPRSTRASPSC